MSATTHDPYAPAGEDDGTRVFAWVKPSAR